MHDDVTTPAPADRGLAALVEVCADGLALLGADRRFRSVNPSACRLLGRSADDLIGRQAPFAPVGGACTLRWRTPDGRLRDLEYRTGRGPDDGTAVWFSDVTDDLRTAERLTAIVRAASSVADAGQLATTLDAVAHEIVQTAHIAAVQILSIDDPAAALRMLGMAGFGAAPDFVPRLEECRRRGADIRFFDAFVGGEPVVVPHRRAVILGDPAWEPLHEIMGRPDWDGFVAMPMVVRGSVVGVINAYYEPGEDPSAASLAFLEAMADHAAVAVDTARLLAHSRAEARSAERRRLARDLHDSVVQQLFSMRMQATALRSHLDRPDADPGRVLGAATELSDMSATALADLRLLVQELRPSGPGERDLLRAVRTHAASVAARTGLQVDVRVREDLPDAGPDAVEDLYLIVCEAVHNTVKHAGARRVTVGLEVAGDALALEVTDDGTGAAGVPADPGEELPSGLGLVSMRERAQRWGGRCTAGPRPDGGWTVQVVVPRDGLDRDGS